MILDLNYEWLHIYALKKKGKCININTFREIYNYRESEKFEVIYIKHSGNFMELNKCIVIKCSTNNKDFYNKEIIISCEIINDLLESEFKSKTRVWKLKQIYE